MKSQEIVLGVTGSIAAYKAPDLVRRFLDAGCQVTCVLTPSASQFVSPLTLAALSGRPVHQDVLNPDGRPVRQTGADPGGVGDMAHLSLAKNCRAVVVAPCTAHFLSQLAQGEAGTLLAALVLTARVPIFLAPAMHEPMWTHPATQKNKQACEKWGYRFLGPVKGPLASGDEGWGRMEDPSRIVSLVTTSLKK